MTAWVRVRRAIEDAVSIAWDGCHKIYVLADEEQHAEMGELGYDPLIRVSDVGADAAFTKVEEWFNSSCGLRFINQVRTVNGNPNDGFSALIEQFEEV